jgi:hypothetical protein
MAYAKAEAAQSFTLLAVRWGFPLPGTCGFQIRDTVPIRNREKSALQTWLPVAEEFTFKS